MRRAKRVKSASRPKRRRMDDRCQDTGPGLPTKAQEHLFTPFQGGARKGGSGLGLAIAAELVAGTAGA